MGKIISTQYQDTVEKVTGFYNDLIHNPFYLYNDQKPVIVTYYNIDQTLSSVDPGSKLIMDNIGKDCPLRFNKIHDVVIYGFNKIQLQSELDEFGAQQNEITGDCVIIPNKYTPTENDYFTVDHINGQKYTFIVTNVDKDTLDNGANAYKINYRLEYNNTINLEELVSGNFQEIIVSNGTNIKSTVRCEDYDIAKYIDNTAVYLKHYFCDLFYNQYVQTFIFEDLTSYRIYDQYMIEFLIRNKILADGEDSFIHVAHIIPPHQTFSIDYDKCFLRSFETKRKDKLLISDRNVLIDYINNYGSVFSTRFETYYKAKYEPVGTPPYTTCALGDDLIYAITDHTLIPEDCLDETKPELWKNILVKYFYNEDLTKEEIDSIENLRFDSSYKAYYIIPLLIFCLEKYMIRILSK